MPNRSSAPSEVSTSDTTIHRGDDCAWPVVDGAVQILPAGVQGRDEARWLQVRRGGLGGSDIAAILNLHPYLTGYEVWLDKTGRLPPAHVTYRMQRGHRYEPEVARAFCTETGLSAKRTGTWARADAPWWRGNPDRLLTDGGLLECKVIDARWSDAWRWGPARYACLQIQWYLGLTGLPHGWLAADLITLDRFSWWRLDRDDELIAEMGDVADWWWHRHIVDGVEPPVDGSRITSDALARAYATVEPVWRDYTQPEPLADWAEIPGLGALVDERTLLNQQIRAAQAQLRGVENRIKASLRGARVGCEHGQPLIAWTPRHRTDVDRDHARGLLPDHPGLFVVTPYRQLENP